MDLNQRLCFVYLANLTEDSVLTISTAPKSFAFCFHSGSSKVVSDLLVSGGEVGSDQIVSISELGSDLSVSKSKAVYDRLVSGGEVGSDRCLVRDN